MIIFLYGPDTYRSRQKLSEIIKGYQKIRKSGLNLKYLDGNRLIFSDFYDETKQISIFKEKKLIILTNVFSNTEFKKKFLEKAKVFVNSENILVFYEENEIPKKDSLLVFLKKQAKSQRFELLKGESLKKWTRMEFKNLGAKIDNQALDKIVAFVDNNLWQMVNEISKLVSFKDGQEIREKDIELLVRPKIEPNIFKTIDAIASRDKKRALSLLKSHLEKGDSPFYLFSMINFQFRNLLVIKDLIERNLSPFGSTKLHPFVVKKSCALSRKFEILELKKIYQKIFRVDLNVKTGRIGPEAALDLLITET